MMNLKTNNEIKLFFEELENYLKEDIIFSEHKFNNFEHGKYWKLETPVFVNQENELVYYIHFDTEIRIINFGIWDEEKKLKEYKKILAKNVQSNYGYNTNSQKYISLKAGYKPNVLINIPEKITKITIFQEIKNVLGNMYKDFNPKLEELFEINIDKYQQIIDNYIDLYKSGVKIEEKYKWKTVNYFQAKWSPKINNPEAFFKELMKIQDNILTFYAQDTLKKISKHYPNEFIEILNYIFNNNIELSKRYEYFRDESKNIIEKLKVKLNKNSIGELREDVFAFFLSCKYPDEHYFYRDFFYKTFVLYVGEKPQKAGEKYFHYLKLMNYFNENYVQKNTEAQELTNKYLEKENLSLRKSKNILAQNIVFLSIPQEQNKPQEKTESKMKFPLNLILYGPPGTGKTYHTINKAVQIIEELTDNEFNQKYENTTEGRKKLKAVFKSYQEEDKPHIEFCTFHQSFSYEDFIEGIKPVLSKNKDSKNNNTNEIGYQIEDGVFKRIVKNAESWNEEDEKDNKITLSENEIENSAFYKLSLNSSISIGDDETYKYCIKNNKITIGIGNNINFKHIKTETELLKLAKDNGIDEKESRFINYFSLYLKTGNYVIISKDNTQIRAIAKVTGNYHFNTETPIENNHFRDVEWLLKDVNIPIKDFYHKTFSQELIYKLANKEINTNFFKNLEKTKIKLQEKKHRNHVLIIDEINRGNVSQIFGELITLIEPDKRRGEKEELSVKLPYSKNNFTVPSNLHIIGTMNTADRSVEALDTALRRRFSFKEMPPKTSVITNEISKDPENKIMEEIDLIKLLDSINNRIEKLIDKDHKIGHSYFLNVKTVENLKICFRDKILPLLEEYFYGDFGKIGLILGNDFVEQDTEKFDFATFTGYEDDIKEDLKERKIYNFTDIKDWKKESFLKIYGANISKQDDNEKE